MPFESIIKKIFESNINEFNEAKYAELKDLFSEHIELISPAVNEPELKIPAVHAKNFDEVLIYWNGINESMDNRITKFEYVELGKKSTIRCFYEKMGLIIDSEIYFDNYGKIYKIVNHLVPNS